MSSFRRAELYFFGLTVLLVLFGCSQSPSAKRTEGQTGSADGKPGGPAFVANNRTNDGRKIVRIPGFAGGLNSLDPAIGSTQDEARAVSQVFETLVQYKYLKRPLQLEPCLLETMPTINEDGKSFHFKLKPGIRFQDDPCFATGKGRELVADDVLYSWKRLADPDVAARNWRLLKNRIVGLDEYRADLLNSKKSNPDVKFDYDFEIEGLKRINKYEFSILLKESAGPRFLWTLARFQMSIVPREAVEKYGTEFGSHPVGTGPFVLTHWSRDRNLIVDRNPNYRAELYPTEYMPADKTAGRTESIGEKLPLVDRVETVFYAQQLPMWLDFRSRKIGFTPVPVAFHEEAFDTQNQTLKSSFENEGITYQPVQLLDFIFVGFNMEHPLLGDDSERGRYLRQAISLAIDWDECNQRFHNNLCTIYDGMIPPGVDGYPENGVIENAFRGPDLTRAAELLVKAGFPGGVGLPEIEYYATGDPPGPEIAEMTAKNLAQVGIKIHSRLYDFPSFIQRVDEKKAPMFSFAWVSDYPDAENNLGLFYGPNQSPGSNRFNYQNADFDRMFESIRSMPVGPERTEIIRKMRDLIVADTPFAGSMAQPVRQYLVNPELKNFKASEEFHNWYKYLDVQ